MTDDDDRALWEAFGNSAFGRTMMSALTGKLVTPDAKAVVIDTADVALHTDAPALTVAHFREVCRAYQAPAVVCRYLGLTTDGVRCCKLIPSARAAVDARAATMLAKGDNCPGRSGAIPGDTPPTEAS